MKCALILYCALLFSFFNCIKSRPVRNIVFEQYHPRTFSSHTKTKVDKIELPRNNYPGISNVFDDVRKHYEMAYVTAGESLDTLQLNKYPKTVVLHKAKYTKSDKNKILYDYDSDVSTTVPYSPRGDVYLDFEEASSIDTRNKYVQKRYHSDLMFSDIERDNDFYKALRGNEYRKMNDLYMLNGNKFPGFLIEKKNQVLPLPARAMRRPGRIDLSLS